MFSLPAHAQDIQSEQQRLEGRWQFALDRDDVGIVDHHAHVIGDDVDGRARQRRRHVDAAFFTGEHESAAGGQRAGAVALAAATPAAVGWVVTCIGTGGLGL